LIIFLSSAYFSDAVYQDNLTLGDVWWLDANDAFSQGLAYVNEAGNAILKVDNSSYVTEGNKRNSVCSRKIDLHTPQGVLKRFLI
jgi:hypothetical protein